VDINQIDATNVTQQCDFIGFKIEVTCGGADFLNVTSGQNKFVGFGFESDPLTSSQSAETTDGIYVDIVGDYGEYTDFHFNTQPSGTNPKVRITGDYNLLSSFFFAGVRGAADVYMNGAQQNILNNFLDRGGVTNVALWMVEMAGVSQLNTLSNFYGNLTSGISVNSSSIYNRFHAHINAGTGSAYTCAGTQNQAEITVTNNTGTGTLVTVSGNWNDTKVFAYVNTACTAQVVLVSGAYCNILPGSRIYNSQLAHGIQVSGSGGKYDEIEVSYVGLHGIYVNAGQPYSISNNKIVNAGLATAATYNGISLEAGADKTDGGVCNGNRILNGSGSLAHAIFVTDNAGSPRYDYWDFVGNNVRAGGDISVSAGNNIIEHNRT
jgi:hypothetical protein